MSSPLPSWFLDDFGRLVRCVPVLPPADFKPFDILVVGTSKKMFDEPEAVEENLLDRLPKDYQHDPIDQDTPGPMQSTVKGSRDVLVGLGLPCPDVPVTVGLSWDNCWAVTVSLTDTEFKKVKSVGTKKYTEAIQKVQSELCSEDSFLNNNYLDREDGYVHIGLVTYVLSAQLNVTIDLIPKQTAGVGVADYQAGFKHKYVFGSETIKKGVVGIRMCAYTWKHPWKDLLSHPLLVNRRAHGTLADPMVPEKEKFSIGKRRGRWCIFRLLGGCCAVRKLDDVLSMDTADFTQDTIIASVNEIQERAGIPVDALQVSLKSIMEEAGISDEEVLSDLVAPLESSSEAVFLTSTLEALRNVHGSQREGLVNPDAQDLVLYDYVFPRREDLAASPPVAKATIPSSPDVATLPSKHKSPNTWLPPIEVWHPRGTPTFKQPYLPDAVILQALFEQKKKDGHKKPLSPYIMYKEVERQKHRTMKHDAQEEYIKGQWSALKPKEKLVFEQMARVYDSFLCEKSDLGDLDKLDKLTESKPPAK